MIIFDVLSPFSIKKVITGLNILKGLEKKQSDQPKYVNYKGINIQLSQIANFKENYEMIITKYLGEKVLQQLSENDFNSSFTRKDTNLENDNWVDIAGLIAPQKEINNLVNEIVDESLKTIESINNRLKELYKNYKFFEWQWILYILEKRFGKKAEKFSTEDIKQLILEWKKINTKFYELVVYDAKKEFIENTQIGYGIDGNEATRHQDFLNVRGSFENNSFVKQMKIELNNKNKQADEVIDNLLTK